jgi:drug/metabolite transporter (DMT)-like permease
MFAIGLAAALVASVLFNVGVALQALDAREAPKDEGLRLTLLGRLFRRPRWVAGFALGALGFPFEVLAFAEAPFVVVQPALAVGLLLLLVLGARMLNERVGRAEVIGVAAIVGGITLIAWGAADHVEAHRSPGQVVTVVTVLSALSVLPIALRGSRIDRAMVVIVASAIGFGASNVATKLMSDDMNAHHFVNGGLWFLVALGTGVAAVLTEMTALQRLAATTAVPISFAIQTFLPIVLEPLFLRESFKTAEFGGAPLAGGLFLMLFGVLAVARTRAVSVLAGGTVD